MSRADRPRRRRQWHPGRLVIRVAASVLALGVLLTLTFLALRLSGNPVLQMLGPEATDQQIDDLTQALGYDRPFLEQYGEFLLNVLRGDFGSSGQYGRPALDVVLERLPVTALLAITGMAGGIVIGSCAGWMSVFLPRKTGAGLLLSLLTAIQAFPAFFKGVVLILLFAVILRWFPTGGFTSWAGLFLPALTLSLAIAPGIGRMLRSSLLSAQRQPHVETAIAKGLPTRRVRRSHIQRNALLPVITIVGLQLATLLGGALIVEQVFSWPGLGQLTFQAIQAQDYTVVLAATFVIALIFLTMNILTDQINGFVDPRTEVRR